MKRRILLAVAAAALCATVLLLSPEHSILVIALPFRWLGSGLRKLSLSGAAGNILSIMLYILIGSLPMLLALKKKWTTENWLLPGACGVLLYALYFMINPGLRPLVLIGDIGDLILSGCFYSLLLSWAVIRLLRSSDTMDTQGIYRTLRIFLWICAVECVWIGAVGGISQLIFSLSELQSGNTMPGLDLLPTQMLLVLSFCVTAAEYILDAFVLLLAVGLLRQLEQDPYSDSCCQAAAKTVRCCKRALTVILLSHTALNLGKMFLAQHLLALDAAFRLPVLSMAIIFAALGLSRLLNMGRQLKEDNDLFI